MFKRVLTFLGSLFASFLPTRQSAVRMLTSAVLYFQLVTFCMLFLHISAIPHVHSSVTGEIIHISTDIVTIHDHNVTVFDIPLRDADDEHCELISTLAHASVFVAAKATQAVPPENANISQEVQIHRLQLVFDAIKALYLAPKNSPPYLVG